MKDVVDFLLFDPMFTVEDIEFCKQMHWGIIQINEVFGCDCKVDRDKRCRRKVERKTLFYMPHCGKSLYNNILKSNWNEEDLKRTIILGNSFDSYSKR